MGPRLQAVLAVLATLVAPPGFAQVQDTSRLGWSLIGSVSDTVRVENTIYAVGAPGNAVSLSGNDIHPFVVLDTVTGFPTAAFSSMSVPDDGGVRSVVDDGAGGWYVGGSFTTVGGTARRGLAHITPTGLDTTFVPTLTQNTGVFAMLRQGSTLYVVGDFSTVDGQARGGGAAFNTGTGALLAWNPQLNASQAIRAGNTLAVADNTVLIGGSFTTASGTSRRGFAAVDATTGALLGTPSTSVDAAGFVSALALSGTTLFLGGRFSSIGGVARANLAAIDTTSGTVLPFQPEPNGDVQALLLDGATLYVGGSFSAAGGQLRSNLARVDATTGTADAWAPGADSVVSCFLESSGTLYVGGRFSVVAGQPRVGVAALSVPTGAALPWNPGLAGGVIGFLPAASGIVVYGGINRLGAVSRPGLAALDIVTNELLPLSITVDATVLGVAASGDTLYLAGLFTRVNGEMRNGFAAVDRFSGRLLSWNPDAQGAMGLRSGGRSVVIRGGKAYLGGFFTSIGSLPRAGLAEVDAMSGAVSAFVGDTTGGGVNELATDAQTLVVAGTFTGIGGQARQSLAAYDLTTASPSLLSLSIALGGGTELLSLKFAGSTLYFGGVFASVNGQPRSSVAAVTWPGGALLPFGPGVTGTVRGIEVSGAVVYVAGTFSLVNGAVRRSFAAVDASTGLTTLGFTPSNGPGNGTSVMAFREGLVAAGSTFQPGLHFYPGIGVGGLPGRPAAPQAWVFPQGLSIAWGPPAVGADPTSYRLEIGSGPGLANVATVPTTDRSFSYLGALPPATFYARVRAVSASGVGEVSPEIAFVTGTAGCSGIAGAPMPLGMVSGGTVTISWPDPPLFPGALTFALDAGTASGTYNIGRIPLGGAHQISTAAPPGAYFLRVAAQGACGVASPSPEILLSVGGVLPLSAPVLSAQTIGGAVSIDWSAVSGATGYEFQAGFGPLDAPIRVPLAGTGLSATAPPGTYYLRVFALGGPAGRSAASNEVVLVVP
jgi:hypothetical protein